MLRIKRLLPASLSLVALAVAFLGTAETASAKSSWYNAWTALYPTSASGPNVVAGTGTSCKLCHVNQFGGNNYNEYGKKLYDLDQSGLGTTAALQGAEGFDSDADPFGQTTLQEIQAGTQPGWTAGPNNTTYDDNGVIGTGQLPPTVAGTVDLCDDGASESIRLGTPPNPNAFLPGQTSGPIVGQVWDPVVDHSTFLPTAILDLMVVDAGPQLNLPLPYGTLLVNYGPTSVTQTKIAGNKFTLPLPLDCAYVGIAATAQVAGIGLTEIGLTNAIDFVIGTH